jgi:uncharacterized RDD family membrane protein YckC
VSASPWRRLAAWLIDWAAILGWAAVTAAVGVPLLLTGVLSRVSPVALNLVSLLVLVLPVVAVLAVLEAGGRQGTFGKRALGLRVRDHTSGAGIGLPRAVLRNALKIGLPWTLGHVAVIAIVATSRLAEAPGWLWPLVAAAYVLPAVFVVSLFVGSRRTPYDRASGTEVTAG